MFGTKSGISSSSSELLLHCVNVLHGVDADDKHDVSVLKAGHTHLSFLQLSQTVMSGIISLEIVIRLNVVSKSREALRLLIRRRYWIAALPLPVGSGTESSLTPGTSAVWLSVPGSGVLDIPVPDGDLSIRLPVSTTTTFSSTSVVWMVIGQIA